MEFFAFKFVYLVENVIFGHIVRIEHKKQVAIATCSHTTNH